MRTKLKGKEEKIYLSIVCLGGFIILCYLLFTKNGDQVMQMQMEIINKMGEVIRSDGVSGFLFGSDKLKFKEICLQSTNFTWQEDKSKCVYGDESSTKYHLALVCKDNVNMEFHTDERLDIQFPDYAECISIRVEGN